MELKDLMSFEVLSKTDNKLSAQVEQVYEIVSETINGISRFYDEYTMHDMNHGLRVAKYMEELAFGIDDKAKERAQSFNALELTLIILCAMLHDIGMFVRQCDEEEIKANRIKYTNSLTFEGVMSVKKNEREAIKEIVRLTHAARIREFLDYDFNGQNLKNILLVNGNYSYIDDIADICQAHGEEYGYLKRMRNESTKGDYTYNPQYIAVLLRIADYLDLDKQRTPILWYATMGISGFSREEWEKHFIIQNQKKLKQYLDGKMQIYFDGKSSNPKIHRKYLKYIDDLKVELENADGLLNVKDATEKYKLNLSTKIADCVQTDGFQYSDLRLNLDYSAITELLMGRNIYGDCRLGLREIIQNSIDACKLMNEAGDEFNSLAKPSIKIIISQEAGFVKVKDTGIGMTLDIVKNHFLNVGKSYYKSDEYLFNAFNYKPIGQYGIGFLACFLLSDNVNVKTKHYKSSNVYQIELEKSSEYVVTKIEETPIFYGTEITLDYDQFFQVFESIDKLKAFLENYFYTEIPIYIKNFDSKEEIEIKNRCEEKIEGLLIKNKKKKSKVTEINCSDFSDKLQGKVMVCPGKNEYKRGAHSLQKKKIYYYNQDEEKFEEAAKLADGYYTYFTYAIIDEEAYAEIRKSKKEMYRKADEIVALAKESGQELMMIVKNRCSFPFPLFYYGPDDEDFLQIKKIIKNSGLPFYEELLDIDRDFSIFVNDGKYVYLEGCSLRTSAPYPRFRNFDGDAAFYFYYKDIYVRDFRGVQVYIPAALEAMGCINYIGSDIKLDVSRNNISEGYECLHRQCVNLILKYLRTTELPDDILPFVDKMIEMNNC